MAYLMAYESKPESSGQVRRGSRRYMTAAQAIAAAQKMASDCNASAMKLTATGNLVAVLWSTNPNLITGHHDGPCSPQPNTFGAA